VLQSGAAPNRSPVASALDGSAESAAFDDAETTSNNAEADDVEQILETILTMKIKFRRIA
jgi:hypothetical protein